MLEVCSAHPNIFFLNYLLNGSFPGNPAFRGYFLGVDFTFFIETKLLLISVFGISKRWHISNSPPNIGKALDAAFTSWSISADL